MRGANFSYEIVLLHGEILKVHADEAFETYMAICQRIEIPNIKKPEFLQKERVNIDHVTFRKIYE